MSQLVPVHRPLPARRVIRLRPLLLTRPTGCVLLLALVALATVLAVGLVSAAAALMRLL